MSHDTLALEIATGSGNDLGRVTNRAVTWSELRSRLGKPEVDRKHSFAEYAAMSSDKQSDLKKAAGFFIGGHCDDGVRRTENIHTRSVVCLDVDEAQSADIDCLLMGLSELSDVEWFAHTTRKHSASKPRWRIILPLLEPIAAEKFQALSRIVASKLFTTEQSSMDAVDDVSFRIAQVMYWPTVSHDGEFETHHNEGCLIDGEKLLDDFGDWEDPLALPFSDKRSRKLPNEYGKRAEDPTKKTGLIGAFCRTYDVVQAIDKFLPHVYAPSKRRHRKPRYTYLLGSGSEGAIVEDGGLFLYSNHGTDPCAERSTNSFDLVRIHLFGDRDKDFDLNNASPTSLPSFKSMEELCRNDMAVQAQLEADSEAALGSLIDDLDDLDEPSSVDDDFDALLDEKPSDDDWDGGSDDDEGDKTPGWVEKLNKRHSVAFVEGKTVILTQKLDGSVAYGSVTDLHNFYENVRRATEKSTEPITKAWMRHSKRASYPNGIVFAPEGGPKGAYNHWKGFSVEPDPTKSCELFLHHLRDVICVGNDEAYQWLIRWFAHMIQRPWEKPGTAVVLKGRKGTGKDTVAEYVGGLFPRHHTKIANAEHLYGRFNAHQEKTLLLHVEEGFWAGDKKAEGSLKYVITSEQVQIEPKGVNAFQVPSVLRVFISSNEDWVVPATFDERRFFVMNVGGKREPAYYTALRHEMKNGGRAALLHFLQNIDMAGYDVRNPPMTEGLRDQKLQSLKNIEKWWYEILVDGDLPGIQTGSIDDDDAGDWSAGVNVGRTPLRHSYEEWMRKHRYEGNVLGAADFGRRLRELVPDLQDYRPRGGSTRQRCYHVPALVACREAFERVLGFGVDWADDA